MKYLVTGGTGFIGSHIAKRLIKDGHEVIITGVPTENKVEGARYIEFNITPSMVHDTGACFRLIKTTANKIGQIDAAFLQAAVNDTTSQDEQKMFKVNYSAPRVLMAILYDFGCKKFICASSTAVYGNSPAPYVEDKTECKPLNVYAKSKLASEKWPTGTNDSAVISLRYCNVYGPGEGHKGRRASMIYQLIKTMKEDIRPRLFQYGWQRRDWIYVEDVVEANLAALAHNKTDIFNCGSGGCVSFNRMIEIINTHLNTWIEPEYIPCPFKKTYQTHTECCMEKAKKILEFIPKYTIEDGIEKLINEI